MNQKICTSLYPQNRSCPHRGCFNYMFTSVTDANHHEMVMHPGQRAQRLTDLRTGEDNLKPRKHACRFPGCPLVFSSPPMLHAHAFAYEHQSARSLTIAANRRFRKGKQKPPTKQTTKRFPQGPCSSASSSASSSAGSSASSSAGSSASSSTGSSASSSADSGAAYTSSASSSASSSSFTSCSSRAVRPKKKRARAEPEEGSELSDSSELSESSELSSSDDSSSDEADSDDEPLSVVAQTGADRRPTFEVGDFVAMQSDGGDGTAVLFVGKVLAKKQRKITVHYMDATTKDFGGCWGFCDDPESGESHEPWTCSINPNIVIGNVKWVTCGQQCGYHMTDGQWDELQVLFEKSSLDH